MARQPDPSQQLTKELTFTFETHTDGTDRNASVPQRSLHRKPVAVTFAAYKEDFSHAAFAEQFLSYVLVWTLLFTIAPALVASASRAPKHSLKYGTQTWLIRWHHPQLDPVRSPRDTPIVSSIHSSWKCCASPANNPYDGSLWRRTAPPLAEKNDASARLAIAASLPVNTTGSVHPHLVVVEVYFRLTFCLSVALLTNESRGPVAIISR